MEGSELPHSPRLSRSSQLRLIVLFALSLGITFAVYQVGYRGVAILGLVPFLFGLLSGWVARRRDPVNVYPLVIAPFVYPVIFWIVMFVLEINQTYGRPYSNGVNPTILGTGLGIAVYAFGALYYGCLPVVAGCLVGQWTKRDLMIGWFQVQLTTWFVLVAILAWAMMLGPWTIREEIELAQFDSESLGNYVIGGRGSAAGEFVLISRPNFALLYPALALAAFVGWKAAWVVVRRVRDSKANQI